MCSGHKMCFYICRKKTRWDMMRLDCAWVLMDFGGKLQRVGNEEIRRLNTLSGQ